jgi:AcrR family transcriptional regulator
MGASRKRTRLEQARSRMYRELVLESAEHVFAEKGFEDATMQQIAAEAGISLKTLYATYPGKTELFRAVQQTRGAELFEAVAAALGATDGPAERLAAGVRAYVDFLAAHPRYLRLLLRLAHAWALPPTDASERGWSDGVAMFAALLRDGIEQGIFADGDPQLLAQMGIAVMQVALARLANGHAAEPSQVADEILLALRRLYAPAAAPRAAAG